jgi:ArsR family transcriptional regulator, arsenate/arsenite/antimonite-responsive transcriptional repressor
VPISASIDESAPITVRLLGDPLRAEIVRRLAVEQLCTCHLVEMTGALQPTVSHHLKVLRDADLVDAIPDGRFTYYRLRPEPLVAVRDALDRLASSATDAPRRRKPCE